MPQPSARVSQRVLIPGSRTASLAPPLQRSPSPAGAAAAAARVLDAATQPNQPLAVVAHQRAPRTPPEEATQRAALALPRRGLPRALRTLSLAVRQPVGGGAPPHAAVPPLHAHLAHAPDQRGRVRRPVHSRRERRRPRQPAAAAGEEEQTQ